MNQSKRPGFQSVLWIFGVLSFLNLKAQEVTVTIHATQSKQHVSPLIYGRNNTFNQPATFYQDAGLRFVRMNGGNNATKYNWRKKITSHPDWYNNVYSISWDDISLKIAREHPDMKVMWAFQLLGRVASNTQHNFNDWAYNGSQWWQGVNQNLAGGGAANIDNPTGKAKIEGNVELYTQKWPADSTVAILNHWFGADGLGLQKDQFAYWSMDNEPDIWNGTHDDVMSKGQIKASEFMDNFIEVAQKARAIYPGIRICGPVTTSEWQWFKWGEESIYVDGIYYSWLEYFIKRCADSEKQTGIRVLDVVDLHHYPYAPKDANALQNHRVFYDKEYKYPGANGIKTMKGGWDNSLSQEYIFLRINEWLEIYYGPNHGITLGLSEWSPGPHEPNLASVIYGTHLGTFANHGVEFFTPWNWFNGMWETLHLYSNYSKEYSVSSVSSDETVVSAYTTVNASADSMTIILVNRDMTLAHEVSVAVNEFTVADRAYKTLQLSELPAGETFVSKTENALKEDAVFVRSGGFRLTLPPLSTTAVLIPSEGLLITHAGDLSKELLVYPNPADDLLTIRFKEQGDEKAEISVLDLSGKLIQSYGQMPVRQGAVSLNTSALSNGLYLLHIKKSNGTSTTRFAVSR